MSVEQLRESLVEASHKEEVLTTFAIKDKGTGLKRYVEFGVISGDDITRARGIRFDIYKRHGYYLNPPDTYENNPGYDSDGYDDGAIFFAAKDSENHIIASARLVIGRQGQDLPIEKAFSFEWPEEVRSVAPEARAEIGKLVSDTPGWMPLGEVIPTLGLVEAILKYSETHNLEVGVSFIKQRLLGRFETLKFPLVELPNYTCVYPNTGIMAPYFHDKRNPPIPLWYDRKEIAKAIERATQSFRHFDEESITAEE